MTAQGPVTVAREVDSVADISPGQVFYQMMVRPALYESPEEMRGCGGRGRREQALGMGPTSTTPLSFWMRD